MKFIQFFTHGNVNPRYIKRWNFNQEKGVLTLHIDGEGDVHFAGQEALNGKQQLEALKTMPETAIQAEANPKE